MHVARLAIGARVARQTLFAFHLCPLIGLRIGGVGFVLVDTHTHINELATVGVRCGEVFEVLAEPVGVGDVQVPRSAGRPVFSPELRPNVALGVF